MEYDPKVWGIEYRDIARIVVTQGVVDEALEGDGWYHGDVVVHFKSVDGNDDGPEALFRLATPIRADTLAADLNRDLVQRAVRLARRIAGHTEDQIEAARRASLPSE